MNDYEEYVYTTTLVEGSGDPVRNMELLRKFWQASEDPLAGSFKASSRRTGEDNTGSSASAKKAGKLASVMKRLFRRDFSQPR